MTDEPDWSQIDATPEQIQVWMRARIADDAFALWLKVEAPEVLVARLAWEAFQHFHRPYHINRMKAWAAEILGAG
jgi:hypothetical protein